MEHRAEAGLVDQVFVCEAVEEGFQAAGKAVHVANGQAVVHVVNQGGRGWTLAPDPRATGRCCA